MRRGKEKRGERWGGGGEREGLISGNELLGTVKKGAGDTPLGNLV